MIKFHRVVGVDIETFVNPLACNFGITEGIAAITAAISGAVGSGLAGLGVGATTSGILGDVAAGGLLGGGFGAITNPKDPLAGFASGALTGGALGVAGPLASGLGIGSTAAKVLAGAGGGTLGAAATGKDLGTGAIGGAASGLASSALDSLTGTSTAGSAPTGSAASTAAPGSVGTDVLTGGPTAPVGAVTSAPLPPIGSSGIETVVSTAPALTGGTASLGGLAGTFTGDSSQKLQSTGDQDTHSDVASPTAGAVGLGAASGQPSNVSGVNTPSTQIGSLAPQGVQARNIEFKPIDLQPGIPSLPPQVGATGADATAGAESGWDKLWKSPTSLLTLGGLGASLLRGNTPAQGQYGGQQLDQVAQQNISRGDLLQSYLTSGTLPPGLQQSINNASSAAEASVRQQYANRGMAGSSAEAQDLQNIRNNASAQSADMAVKLLNAGVQQSQLGAQLYQQLLRVNMEQDSNLSSSIGNLVSAFSGMSKPIQFNLGG